MEVQDELLTSYAWKHFTSLTKLIYLYCSLQHVLSKRTVVNTSLLKLIKKTNLRLFEMSYDTMEQYIPSLTRSEYYSAMRELYSSGFIKHNPYTRSENAFMLVDDWKNK